MVKNKFKLNFAQKIKLGLLNILIFFILLLISNLIKISFFDHLDFKNKLGITFLILLSFLWGFLGLRIESYLIKMCRK